jgi:hypothetical protein
MEIIKQIIDFVKCRQSRNPPGCDDAQHDEKSGIFTMDCHCPRVVIPLHPLIFIVIPDASRFGVCAGSRLGGHFVSWPG